MVGGSIRVPAAFNNLYGIRTSHGRLPYAKMANSNEGQETVHSVVGPMGHSAPGEYSKITGGNAKDRFAVIPYIDPGRAAMEVRSKGRTDAMAI